MERLYKSLMGWHPADNKHEGTHLLLSKEEYDELHRKIEDLEEELDRVIEREERNAQIAQNKALKEIEEIQQDAKKQIADEKEKYQTIIHNLQEQINNEKNLNQNLIRIAIERANKSRKINKNENGYLILECQSFHYKRTLIKGKKKVESYDLYKITVQMPWDCSLPEKIVDNLLKEALRNGTLKITNEKISWFESSLDLDTALDFVDENEKIILVRQYKAKGTTGLWEVTLITNFEPMILEEHRIKYV